MPKHKLETYYLIAFSLLGLFPVVPFIVKPFLLVPLLLTSLINVFFINENKIGWKKVIMSTLLYFLFVVSVIYSTNVDRAITLLVRLLPFLFLPFSLGVVPEAMYKKLTETFIQVYIISCAIFCFVIFIYCMSLDMTDIYVIYSYISNNFWGYADHPIYISLYFGIALILLLFKNKRSFLNILLFVIILFTLLFLSRKGNIIGLVLILFYVIIANYKNIFKKHFIGYTLAGTLITIGVSYLFNNFLFIRFQEILNLNQVLYNPGTSTGIRSILWRTSLNLSFESPYFGYGLGSVQDLISSRLIENGYEELTSVVKYNSHNQYLQILLIGGYIGLILFLIILSYIFLKIKNIRRALCVFLYIIFCFLFESLLERQNGIIITALFFNLFLFFPNKKEILNE